MSSSQEPSKADVEAILKRLRTISANKCCFDCGAKNPTWSSITYGIFICIDCSATHRSLGVHISFVKSTQLDTNWSWLQLRSMQMGGNSNASTFFAQQSCTTKDSQQKYNSRAAQLYREKLSQAAIKAQRTHGTKLHIEDGSQTSSAPKEKEQVDFFQEATFSAQETKGAMLSSVPAVEIKEKQIEDKSHEGPNVLGAMLPGASLSEASTQVKSNILQKKPAPTKKKGLGAQKVNTDFKEIERQMQEQERNKELEQQQIAKNKEEEEKNMEKQMASMKLAYNNLDKQRAKEETKLMQSDPKKAQQLERLGMAAGNRSSGIKHSAVSDMQIIQQDSVSLNRNNNNNGSSSSSSFSQGLSRDFFDRNDHFGAKSSSNRFDNDDDFFGGFGGSSGSANKAASDWVVVDNNDKFKDDTLLSSSGGVKTQGPGIISMDSDYSKSRYQTATSGSAAPAAASNTNSDATKRFGNAKSISSQQYFGDSSGISEAEQARNKLSRFENSTSISSEDYFGDGRPKLQSQMSGGNYAPDMNIIKQDLKEGVTKVAGKLSNMASNMMSSLQN